MFTRGRHLVRAPTMSQLLPQTSDDDNYYKERRDYLYGIQYTASELGEVSDIHHVVIMQTVSDVERNC